MNTIKYAVNARDELQLRISIKLNANIVELLYQDNEAGYPNYILRGEIPETSLGCNLIKGIVLKSLRGTVEFMNDNGAITRITFPRVV